MSIVLRSLCMAVLINTIAFIGILYFNWNLYVLFFTFWCEMILIIVFTKFARSLHASIDKKKLVSVHWGFVDLWWLFWLFIHFLFLFVLMKDPMKEIIHLPDEWVTPSTLFPLLIGYSLIVPAVLISILVSILVHYIDYRKDKMDWEVGIFNGYNMKSVVALPYIYLVTNHVLLFIGAEFYNTNNVVQLTFAVASVKVCSDTIIYAASGYKKRISSTL